MQYYQMQEKDLSGFGRILLVDSVLVETEADLLATAPEFEPLHNSRVCFFSFSIVKFILYSTAHV